VSLARLIAHRVRSIRIKRYIVLVFGHDRLSAVGRGRSHCLVVILPVVVFLPVVFSHSLTRDRVERARERRQDPVEHGGRADQVALIYDSPVTSTKKSFTYKELLDEVSRFAAILVDEYDLKCGDRAVIYMPMIPEAVITMLACARTGEIHSIMVF
jgi:hypothetical protein